MSFDRSHFFLMTAALAAGGAGGWVLRDQDPLALLDPNATEPVARGAPAAPAAPAEPEATAPACDDSVGAAGVCPPMGPAAEGVCSNYASKRCGEFKTSFKPKVAENAVTCIRGLTGAELCNAARVDLCGHAALMSSCQEVDTYTANAREEGVTPPPSSSVTTECAAIVKSCGAAPLAPSIDECRRTISGMNAAGRAAVATCMAAHCTDRGLIGCEAVTEPHSG